MRSAADPPRNRRVPAMALRLLVVALVVLLAGHLTPSDNGVLADVAPCDLLDGAGLAVLGLDSHRQLNRGGKRGCMFSREGAPPDDRSVVWVTIHSYRALDLARGYVQPLPDIGGHPAGLLTDPGGTCSVEVGVGDSSLVEFTAGAHDQLQACQRAAQVATLVEPALP